MRPDIRTTHEYPRMESLHHTILDTEALPPQLKDFPSSTLSQHRRVAMEVGDQQLKQMLVA